MKLRDYQEEAVQALRDAKNAGTRRPSIVIPTGGGKTQIFSSLAANAARNGARILVFAHRTELIQQAYRALDSWVDPGIRIGIVQGDRNEVDAQIVVGSVQTLRPDRLGQLGRRDLVICDECFPADTLVDGRPISEIRVGDVVSAWDETTGDLTRSAVTQVMVRQPSALVEVELEDGEKIACTPEHPFLTTQGWMPAAELHGASVIQWHHASISGSDLHGMRESRHGADGRVEDSEVSEDRQGVLLDDLQGRVGESKLVRANVPDEQEVCVGSDEGQESDAPRGISAEDVCDTESDWACPKGSRGKRVTHLVASGAARGSLGVADRGHHQDRQGSVPLQTGHRAPDDVGGDRGGRGLALLPGSPRIGSAEGRVAHVARVARVSVLEPGGDGLYGGMCPGGLVYNLEVEGTHTYLVGEHGTTVHNCHHASSPTYKAVFEHFDRAFTIGVTATMMRADGKRLADVWDDVVYERTLVEMIEEGYLVEPRGKVVEVADLHMENVATSRGDYVASGLANELHRALAPKLVAEAYREHAADRLGILFAPTVASSYEFSEALIEHGISSAVVHGGMKSNERAEIFAEFRPGGAIQVLANCNVATEGYDNPAVSCVVMARPTKSQILYTQAVGRGLRLFPGKEDALILDVCGVTSRMRIVGLTDLFGAKKREDETGKEAAEEQEDLGEKLLPEDMIYHEGESVSVRDIELFERSKSAWMRTKGGIWYLPGSNMHWVYFLMRNIDDPGLWNAYKAKLRVSGIEDVVKGVTIKEARSICEKEAGGGISKRAWRETDDQITAGQWAKMISLGLKPTSAMRKGEASDLISTEVVSERLDNLKRRPAATMSAAS